MFTYEQATQMTTEELFALVYDWYKDVHGVRPRWVDPNNREFFLAFIEYELDPEIQAFREEQWKREFEWAQHQEECLAWLEQQEQEDYATKQREANELAEAYPSEWDWYELNV